MGEAPANSIATKFGTGIDVQDACRRARCNGALSRVYTSATATSCADEQDVAGNKLLVIYIYIYRLYV